MDEIGNDNQGNYQQPATSSMPQQSQAPTPPIHHHKLAFIFGIIVVVVAIAVISAILSLSSNVSSGSQGISAAPTTTAAQVSPRTMLINDLAAAKSVNNVGILYNIRLPTLSQYNISASQYNISGFTDVLGRNVKSGTYLVTFNISSTIINYDENGINAICVFAYFYPTSCSISNATSITSVAISYTPITKSVPFILNSSNVSIIYMGKSKVLNRTCNAFSIKGDSSVLLSAAASTSQSYFITKNSTFTDYMCIDNQTGMPLSMNISSTKYSQLLGGNRSTVLLTMKATNVSVGSVTNAEMAIPVTVLIKGYRPGSYLNYPLSYVNCSSSSISFNVIPTVNLNNIDVNGTIFGYVMQQNGTYAMENTVLFSANETGNYKAFSQYPMSFAVKNASHITAINICANGACESDMLCYVKGSTIT